jgi:hypothetical protein
VAQLEILVWELMPVNTFTACAIEVGEVSALHHEILDHSVENGVLVGQKLASHLTSAKLPSAELAEILSSARDNVFEELHCNPSLWIASDFNVKEDPWV